MNKKLISYIESRNWLRQRLDMRVDGHADYEDFMGDDVLLKHLEEKLQQALDRGYIPQELYDIRPTFFLSTEQCMGAKFKEDLSDQLAWRVTEGGPVKSPHDGKTFYNIYNILGMGAISLIDVILGHEYRHAILPGKYPEFLIQLQDFKNSIKKHTGLDLSLHGKQLAKLSNDFNDVRINLEIIIKDYERLKGNKDGKSGIADLYRVIRDNWRYEEELQKKKPGQVQERSPFWAIVLRTYEILNDVKENYILQDSYSEDTNAVHEVHTYKGPVRLKAWKLDEKIERRAEKLAEFFRGSTTGKIAIDRFVEIVDPFIPAEDDQSPEFDFCPAGVPTDRSNNNDKAGLPIVSDRELDDIAGKLIGRARSAGGKEEDYQKAVDDYQDIVCEICRDPEDLSPLYKQLMKLDLFNIKKFPELVKKGRPIRVKKVPMSRFPEADLAYSVGASGVIIPGETTYKFAPLVGKKREEGKGYPNLHVWVDMSSSSENPRGKLSPTRIGPGRAIYSWLKLSPKVLSRLTMFDCEYIDTGWSRDENLFLKMLMRHDKGGTNIHETILEDCCASAEEFPYFSIWYSDLTGFGNVTPERIQKLAMYFRKATGSLIFLTPDNQGRTDDSNRGKHLFAEAGVPFTDIYTLEDLKALEKLSIEVIHGRLNEKRTIVKGPHAESIIRRGTVFLQGLKGSK